MIGLAFSGGRDSWACLHLNKDRLQEITVLWVNTGKNYPEALEMIERAKRLCPHFVEIKVDRGWQNYIHGIPSDVIPFANTSLGQSITGDVELKVQSYFQCCYDNISAPLMEKVKELGITQLISGKRNDEGHLSSSHDGEVIDGVKHSHPIETWTSAEVLAYLAGEMQMPEHFRFSHSSLDCYDCTAYRKNTKDVDAWASRKHPALHYEKTIRLEQLRSVLKQAVETI